MQSHSGRALHHCIPLGTTSLCLAAAQLVHACRTATAADQPVPPLSVNSLPANSRQHQQQQQLRSTSSSSPSSSLPQRTSDAMECSFEVVAEVVPLSRGASQAGSMCSAGSSAGSEDGRRRHQAHAIDVPQQARESRPSSSSAALLVRTHARDLSRLCLVHGTCRGFGWSLVVHATHHTT